MNDMLNTIKDLRSSNKDDLKMKFAKVFSATYLKISCSGNRNCGCLIKDNKPFSYSCSVSKNKQTGLFFVKYVFYDLHKFWQRKDDSEDFIEKNM